MRAIVYDEPVVRREYQDLTGRQRPSRGTATQKRKQAQTNASRKGEAERQPKPGETPADGYLTKIAKYVPAETITLMSLALAAFEPTGRAVWWWVAAGAIANCTYLFAAALKDAGDVPLPRWYFYVLSVLALVLWAAATLGPVRREAHLVGDNGPERQTFVLALAAFIIPALDTAATRIVVRVNRQ